MARRFDVVVIGNASLGLGLAHALKRRDPKVSVCVVGPAARVGAATTTAGAMINVWAELAPKQFDNPALADRAQLGIDSIGLWDSYCSELSEFGPREEALKVDWGTLVLNNAAGSPHEQAYMDYLLEVLPERGVAHELVDPRSVPWLKPRAAITRLLRVPDGRIRPHKVLAALERALDAKGVTRLNTEVVSVKLDAADKHIACADGELLVTQDIVFANGSFAQALIDQLPDVKKHTPRLVWGAGAAVDLTLPDWVKKYGGIDPSIMDIDVVVRTVDRGGACGVHLVPYGNGDFYLGASSGVWFDPEPKPRVHGIHVLLHSLVEEFNGAFFFSTMSIRGPGFRPTAVDTFPLLGESHVKGVWFANGTKRDGFTLSPYVCRELASNILGGQSSLPARFTPSRSLISYKRKAEALADTVGANFGGEIQHGLALPAYAVERYRNAMLASYEAIYAKRDIAEFGIHPEVIHLYENDDFYAAIEHPREF